MSWLRRALEALGRRRAARAQTPASRTVPLQRPGGAVVCSECGVHVYDLRAGHADYAVAADFVPVHEGVLRPVEGSVVRCPLCGSAGFMGDIQQVASLRREGADAA
jgi:hypothetical protein